MKNFISLGAGVQSTTMALMAATGEIGPTPDGAIFADTGWEPQRVYEHLDWLEKQLPFPVYRVSNGNIRSSLTSKEKARYDAVPFFLSNGGLGRRQCSHEFKVKPIRWKTRELLGVGRKDRLEPNSAVCGIGISTDEAHRMKPTHVKWITNCWPLIEKRMSRADCSAWLLKRFNRRAPKSSCIGCPFHSDEHWRDMRDNSPDEWADAIRVDDIIRNGGTISGSRSKQQQYMHRQLVPLSEADIDGIHLNQPDMFGNECEGMCGA